MVGSRASLLVSGLVTLAVALRIAGRNYLFEPLCAFSNLRQISQTPRLMVNGFMGTA